MNIYLIEPTDEGWDYVGIDCNEGHVVIAENTRTARKICPISDEGDIWTNPKLTKIVKIGETNKKAQVVLSNFHSG